MAKEKEYEFDANIDRPYNNFMERSIPDSYQENGSVESQPVKEGGAMNDIWIKNFIRSDKWKPKSVGFYIDGRTGYAEFTDVFISGEISAEVGDIGGFIIGSDYIRDAQNTMGLSSVVSTDDDVRFWSGASFEDRSNAPFKVTKSGVMTATDASITGSFETAASGNRIVITSDPANRISFFTDDTEVAYIEVDKVGNTGSVYFYSADGNAGLAIDYDVLTQSFTSLALGLFQQGGTATNGYTVIGDASGTASRSFGFSHESNGTPFLNMDPFSEGEPKIRGNWTPEATNTYDLGESATPLRWRTIYLVNSPNVSSDVRFKENVKGVKYGLKEVLEIEPISFNRKDDDVTYLGFSAQNLKTIIPEVVSGEDQLSIRPDNIIPVLVNAIKELNQRISDLENKST